MNQKLFLYCWLPVFSVSIALLLIMALGEELRDIGLLLLVMISMSSLGFVTFWAYVQDDIHDGWALSASITCGFFIIALFAEIHASAGIMCAAANCQAIVTTTEGLPLVHDRSDGFYFPVVTFTTLGYGDFQPHPYLRPLAALQALVGYIFLGFTVGSAWQSIARNGTANKPKR